jgi:hypothetical protein
MFDKKSGSGSEINLKSEPDPKQITLDPQHRDMVRINLLLFRLSLASLQSNSFELTTNFSKLLSVSTILF